MEIIEGDMNQSEQAALNYLASDTASLDAPMYGMQPFSLKNKKVTLLEDCHDDANSSSSSDLNRPSSSIKVIKLPKSREDDSGRGIHLQNEMK